MQLDKGILYSLLSGLSLLFLLGFLVYWNVDNYNRTKEELKQDLSDQMDLSIAEYQDSLIQGIFKIIEIDSTGTPNLDFSYVFSTDSVTHEITPKTHTVRGNQSTASDKKTRQSSDTTLTVMYDAKNDRKIIAWKSDIIHIDQTIDIKIDTTEITTINLQDRAVFDSLSKQVADIDIVADSSLSTFPNIYASINKIYKQRLDEAQLPSNHVIKTQLEIETEDIPRIAIAYSYGSLSGDQQPYAIFEGSSIYVLKEILPSLILSILLLGGVATSFYLIIKNWRSQLQLAAVKDEFISNMTHELKTPISTVGVALEALENFGVIDDREKRKEYLDISKHELERLKILVDKVLKMSTLDKDLDTVNFSKLDIRQITEGMLHSMSPHFKKHEASINYNCKGDDFSLQGDKVHLVNVLYNIIDNAIKYSIDRPHININLTEDHSHVSLSVRDHGPGIDSAYLPKIFDRLFRIPTDARHNVKGHGLGLHYVKTVIEKHRGTITATSEKGKGTTFFIKIPREID